MPFPTYQIQYIHERKESDSFIAQHITPHTPRERVSGFTLQGSVTVEASLAVSIFFFAMITLMSLFEIMHLQIVMKTALCSVGRQMAVESSVQPIIFPAQMEARLAEEIGEDFLDNSMIRGGSEGLDCSRSRNYFTTTIMDLVVDYELEIPGLFFHVPVLERSSSIRIKGWSGKEGLGLGFGNGQVVYMTEYGMVYHTDMSCTYLELSIHPILKEEAKGYTACSYCGKFSEEEMVYVTDYGERYHTSLDCRGLKRKVYTVALEDVYGIGGCGKCVHA